MKNQRLIRMHLMVIVTTSYLRRSIQHESDISRVTKRFDVDERCVVVIEGRW